jgi:aldehyde dehydrogenase (NAD+)
MHMETTPDLDADWFWIDGVKTAPGPQASPAAIVNPATGLPIANVVLGGPEDMAAAVESAHRTFLTGTWSGTPVAERVAVLRRAYDLLHDRIADLTSALTLETGSPIAMGAAPVSLEILSNTADSLQAEVLQESRFGVLGLDAIVRRVPTGVVGAIAPWNAPLYLSLNKVAPALAAGCSVVLKPAPNTPLDAYMLAEALSDSGLPRGAFNVVPADREVGELLVRSPDVQKISFTGSTSAGRRIASLCGEQLKRVSLELGGKSAAVVLDDADVASQVPLAVMGGMINTGQACAALTRILVPRSRVDEMTGAVVAAVGALPIGDPFDATNILGPIISESQLKRVEGYVALGVDEGATVACGGHRLNRDGGWWFAPTVLTGVSNDMRVAREEIFGPVLVIIPYDGGDDEAVRLANDSEYGLSGAVFSADLERALNVAVRIRSGTVGANSIGMDPAFPFGGFKASGIGRESSSREGLSSYLETQSIGLPMRAVDWPNRIL